LTASENAWMELPSTFSIVMTIPTILGRRTANCLIESVTTPAIPKTDYNFWNYFSAYVAENAQHIKELEGILIAAMPTAVNSANPRIPRISLPVDVAQMLRMARRRAFEEWA
jgi:hypothetical protein